MTEQQNLDIIRAAFEAFRRGDVQAILDHCAADCEFHCPGPAAIPYAGTMRGRKEIEGYFDKLIGTQTGTNLTIDQFVTEGDTVIGIGRYRATVKSTGKSVDSPVVLTFQMKDGKIARHMVVGDTAALAAGYTVSASAAS